MDIPEFTTGPPQLRQRLNDIIRAVNKFNQIRGDEFIKVNRTPSAVAISLSIVKLEERLRMFSSAGEKNYGFFKLSAVASNPMTGKIQTCSSGSFGDAVGATNVSIYKFPQISLEHYEVDNYIFAIKCGDSWIATYSIPVAFDFCPLDE